MAYRTIIICVNRSVQQHFHLVHGPTASYQKGEKSLSTLICNNNKHILPHIPCLHHRFQQGPFSNGFEEPEEEGKTKVV